MSGGSYMSQPCLNSEAVRRCLNVPNLPMSNQVARPIPPQKPMQPKPPYALGSDAKPTRPYSAPHRTIVAPNPSSHADPWRSPSYHDGGPPARSRSYYVNDEYPKTHPYANRKRENFVNSSMGYPVVQGGKGAPLPPYDPLYDPHLVEYFERRFGAIQARHRTRPSSAPGMRDSRYKQGYGKKLKADAGEGPVLYKVFITTADKKGAGTDAKAFVSFKGTKSKVTRTRLTKKAGSVRSNKGVSFKFSKGTTHMFKIRGPEVGDIKSLCLEHDGLKKEDGWFVQEVEVVNTKRKKSWLFMMNTWLSLHHTDGHSKREFFPHLGSKTDYEVVVVTGDKMVAGTDSNVFVTIYGKTGATQKTHLKNPKLKKTFQQGQSDVFKVHSNCCGPLTKIKIEHDNIGFAPGWFLDRVVVTDMLHPKWKYYFPCGQWLAKDEGDGAICRTLLGSRDPFAVRKDTKYKISIFTGDKRGAGTDANVYVILFGENGDSGEKYLDDKKNNYERGMKDEFVVETPCLGRLDRIRVGHDNTGFGPGWFLDKVIVDDLDNQITYSFPCNRWLATDQDDGALFRDLIAGKGAVDVDTGIPYVITVSTGDKSNAGTDAKVFVVLHNGKKKQDSGKVWLSEGNFKRNKTDIFNINLQAMLSPLTSLEIGHDNGGVGPGWFCDQVLVFCPNTGIEQQFPCKQWLATNEGDGLIQRTLYENTGMRKQKDKKTTWNIWVKTSDTNGAGTDANVSICLYGKKGKTEETPLDNKDDNFEKGSVDHFKVNMADVGQPYKLRVYHDNGGRAPGWHLDKIDMENMKSGEHYTFECNRWLADDEDDLALVREMPAKGSTIKNPLPVDKYSVQVYTGSKSMAGTDANVYINIFGERGDTGVRFLKKSGNFNKFEKGQTDEFELEAVSVLKLTKIRIGHDGKGIGAGWYLEKVVVRQIGSTKYDQEFVCQRWLAEDMDDGLIEREITASGAQMLSTTSYHVHVKTGDVSGAGTNANVYMLMFGEKGDSGKLQLRQSASFKNKWERGKTDIFTLEATNIGKLKRIQIGHDGSGIGAGWFLDEVKILVPSRGEQYVFACHRWLATDEGDGLLEVEMEPSYTEDMQKTIPYEVTIWTGNVRSAGTDANVFLQMYGQSGKTESYNLRNKTDNFEQEACDKFKIEALDIGRIQKVRIGHDGTGMFAGWFMERMLIQRKPRKGTKKFRSASVANLDRDRDRDRDRRGRRSPEYGRRSPEHGRKSPVNSRMGDFSDSDDSDISSVSTSRRRGSKIRGRSPKQNLSKNLKTVKEEEEEYDGTETEDYWFLVSRWFARSEDDKQIVRELIPTDEKGRPLKGGLEEVSYAVHVYTGDEFGAGTDANVFVAIYGDKGDTGERQLKDSSTNMNKFERKQESNLFERNQEDIFTVKAIELGKLTKLKIRHDNKGGGAAWFLDRVEVEDPKTKIKYFFPCQRWLSVKADDGQISRELVPVDPSLKNKLSGDSQAVRNEIALETKAAMQTYYVKVATGTVWGAGTDANVYCVLYGENDDTGLVMLKSSRTHSNKFESGNTDEFTVEAVNIGELKKIKIGHDNKGGGAAWFLDKVIIDCPSLGRSWTFPANRWLAKNKGDNLLEVELQPQDLATEEYIKCIPYEIVTTTSDVTSGGTSANVYIQLYGKEAATMQKELCISKLERKDKFKRKSTDTFVLEMEDVGETIEKIRIGHDNSGLTAGWHLDEVKIRRLHESGKDIDEYTPEDFSGSITYLFPCKRWLARDEGDGAIEVELVAGRAVQEVLKNGEVQTKELKLRDKLEKKVYTVTVNTGDKSGCGTNANVFMIITGDRGDTGERKLAKSETHMDKFERKQTDIFKLEAADLGRIYKIHVRHDNSGFSPAWYLDSVEIAEGRDKYMFHCERWLAKNKDDAKLERSFYVKGYDGEMSSTGTLRSTRYGSVASLDSMRSSDPFSKSPRMNRKQLSMEDIPEGPTIPYTIRVITGEGEDNGTDSNVWVKIWGPKKKHSGKMFLELAQKSSFTPGSTEIFSIEAVDVGEVKKVEVGHDGTAPGTGWFLKEIEVDMPTKGKHYTFACKQWLAREKSDGKTSRMFSVDDGISSVSSYKPMIPYEMTVYTGDVEEAGTDQKITITVFGAKGTTTPTVLEKNGDRFERDRADLIRLELEDVAPVKKLRVEVDGKGSRPEWFLEKVELRNMSTGILSVFDVRSWFGKGKGDLTKDIAAKEGRKIMIDKTNYKVNVKTSTVKGAGTDANVFVILFGDNGDSGTLHLKKSETYKDPFENDQLDVFTFNDILSLGELSKCRVWHDNKGFGAAWHLGHIEVEDLGTRKSYNFQCNKWLSKSEDDKQILRELTCGTSAKGGSPDSRDKTTFEIEVKTSDKKEGGTYHNGWVMLEGRKNTSKVFKLENSPTNKILRKGHVDHFSFNSAPLGDLVHCVVGAFERDDRKLQGTEGREAEWHCFEVSVTDTGKGKKYIFPCKDWIQICERVNKRYGKVLEVKKVEESHTTIVRNLATVNYEVVVYTGDKFGAGTNANVTLVLFGENGDTGPRPLKQRMRDLFERKQIDKFTLEAVDLGKLTKLHIGHDNSGFRPKWHLDKIEVTNSSSGETTLFSCDKWFDKDNGDCCIERDLYPRD